MLMTCKPLLQALPQSSMVHLQHSIHILTQRLCNAMRPCQYCLFLSYTSEVETISRQAVTQLSSIVSGSTLSADAAIPPHNCKPLDSATSPHTPGHVHAHNQACECSVVVVIKVSCIAVSPDMGQTHCSCILCSPAMLRSAEPNADCLPWTG